MASPQRERRGAVAEGLTVLLSVPVPEPVDEGEGVSLAEFDTEIDTELL